MSIFTDVKQAVSTKDAAICYGIHVNRNGMAKCPFHSDKHPSMKVDQRFHCFGCGADGDVICFAEMYFDLSPYEAANRLAQDFHVQVEYDNYGKVWKRKALQKEKSEYQQMKEYQKIENWCYRTLGDYRIMLQEWIVKYSPRDLLDEWHPYFVEALQKETIIEYWLDLLLFGTLEERMMIVRDLGKEIVAIERRMEKYRKEHSEKYNEGGRRDTEYESKRAG